MNNAALINANGPLWQVPTAEFDRLIDVNVKGVANVLRDFLPRWSAAERRHRQFQLGLGPIDGAGGRPRTAPRIGPSRA